MTADKYPPLPEQVAWRDNLEHCDLYWRPADTDDKEPLFTADQMRAYVDADRASRTAAGSGISDAAEPVAWAATDETGCKIEALGFNESRRFDTPLYLGAAPRQAPLTDEQIDRIWSNSTPSNFEARSFARAIERALGISAAKP